MEGPGDGKLGGKRLWARFLVLLPLVLALAFGSWAYISSVAASYTAVGFQEYGEGAFAAGEVTLSEEGVVEVASVERTRLGTVGITFHALADGQTTATFTAGGSSETWRLEVRDGAIIEGGVDFTGWESILACLCVFLAVVVVLFWSVLARLQRAARFGYAMIASCGGMLFCLFQLLFFSWLLLFGQEPGFSYFIYDLLNTANFFIASSLAPMALLALLVIVSNVSLIRHEGMRPQNLLGIAASLVWFAAIALWLWMGGFEGSVPAGSAALRYLNSLVAVAIAYGECLLMATILCAWFASRHEPQANPEYLVILGCGIRSDGTPSPLLAGRVDKAVAFDAARTVAGEAPAVFVPSGGQGPDEPVSEAQSMADYLSGRKGVARERVVLEDHSTTTRENMRLSREAIERHAGRDVADVRVAFSTTNYHVFRGYVCAGEAGMVAEGMGSKTRYYFWPNAFLREFAGLLSAQRKAIVQTYAVIAAVYVLAETVLLHI